MGFRYACFVSYSGTDDEISRTIVRAFCEQLVGQLRLYIPKAEVFVDELRLGPGDRIDPALARELCQSCCMVLLHNPYYFDLEYPFCAREYRAMRSLEQDRVDAADLVIPVILRGDLETVPGVLRDSVVTSFDADVLCGRDLGKRKCLDKIKQIAQAVFDRYRRLKPAEHKLTACCAAFKLPSPDEIQPWLKDIVAERDGLTDAI